MYVCMYVRMYVCVGGGGEGGDQGREGGGGSGRIISVQILFVGLTSTKRFF